MGKANTLRVCCSPVPDMRQIRCLTSLRFFAAAMIVAFHSVNAFGIGDNRKIPFALGQGVSFFFVLSGFILTYVYPSLSGRHRIRNFYVARIARIWPAHFVTFLLLLWLIPSAGWVWKGEHCWQIGAANVFLVHGWIPSPSYYFSFNSVSWSISTEAFFYLAFPFLICRLDRSWWWKLLCTAGFVVAMLGLTSFLKLSPLNVENYSAITAHGVAYINPIVRILEFVCGMAVASLCLRWRELKIVASLPVWLWTIIELVALAVTLLSVWYDAPLLSSLSDGRTQDAFALYVGECGSFPAFGLLIGVLSFERGIVSRFLSVGWLVLLGEISYSIYLVHQILIRWYDLHQGALRVIPRDARYVLFWLAVVVASLVIWCVVEKPCQRWIRKPFRITTRPPSAEPKCPQHATSIGTLSSSLASPIGES
jgi:peptidoglycan/LPS O-acetylase OafA/YrhL